MGAESQRKAGEADGNGATPDTVKAHRMKLIERLGLEDRQIDLIERLGLDEMQIEALGGLDEDQLELWFRALEESFAPEDWLTGIDEAIQGAKPVPAFYVPTAEGIATYPGLLGTNGSSPNGDKRDREIKEIVIGLLQNAIGALPEGKESSNGHSNGNGNGAKGSNDETAEEKAEKRQQT
jgi:hypothetical protein